ncbi:S-layer homology domain-containing protein [Paenibacillus oralis]|uniref:S-layer homology domain-containing protein n=1 Tax=Paenibacillus oralis TaxID=2490856 RepID=UPI001FEC2A70|nr:S-layer homology domain-containing protein [Paenibacillus oralis]
MSKKLLSMLLCTALTFGLWSGLGASPVAEAAAQDEPDEPMILLPRNSEWKYFDQGQDLMSVWRATYDDSSWDSGFAPFGYKDNGSGIATSTFGPLNTEVDYGPDKNLKHRTTYFRTNLQVNKDEIDGYGQLLGTFGIDDGAVVYVNGHEAVRFGMPAGEITYSTKAGSSKDLPVLYEDVDLTAPLKSYLKDGDNEIAVEVHQQSDSSSDLYFDMELKALVQALALEISKVTVTFYGDATSAKGFTWYTPLGSSRSDVQVVENRGGEPDFSQAQTFSGRTSVSSNSPGEHVHKAEATGLAADTSYYFRVGDAALGVWSGTGTFRTAPEKGAFTFIDLADTQAKDEEEAVLSSETLAKALAAVPEAQFVVHNGDIVDTGVKEEQWNWLLGHSQESLLHTTLAPSAGNHEDENYAFIEHFNLKVPEKSAIETGAYYSYNYSNAHFVILNSNEDSDTYDNFSVEQVEWLKQDVQQAKKAGAQWIIVNIHKGPYTTSNHATDSDIMGTNGVRNKIASIMAELDIDFVLQGHDHIYARTKPIKADGKATEPVKITEMLNGEKLEYSVNPDGTIYLIPATAGPKVYYKNPSPDLGDAYYSLFERAEENHAAKYGPDPKDNRRPKRSQVQNFVGITIDGGKLTAVAYEIDQNLNGAQPFIIDQFGIEKKGAATPNPGSGNSGSGNSGSGNSGSGKGSNPVSSPGSGSGSGAGSEKDANSGNGTNPDSGADTGAQPGSNPGTGSGRANPPVLKDIQEHWAKAAIDQAVAAGFVNGYADGTFRPNQQVTRAEFVTMLGRALDLNADGAQLSFTDASKIPSWATEAVAEAVAAGIISGYKDGSFGPHNPLNRAELTAMIVRAGGIRPDSQAKLAFNDAKDIPAWAAPYVAAAVDAGLVDGVGNNRFAPQQVATRAEAITLVVKLLEFVK